jgi:hypothetical protein
MSRNDQLLVKKHKGRFYVFSVMAESWGEWRGNKPISKKNYLYKKEALGIFQRKEDAILFAEAYDKNDEWGRSEYGVIEKKLFKDGAKVYIK